MTKNEAKLINALAKIKHAALDDKAITTESPTWSAIVDGLAAAYSLGPEQALHYMECVELEQMEVAQ